MKNDAKAKLLQQEFDKFFDRIGGNKHGYKDIYEGVVDKHFKEEGSFRDYGVFLDISASGYNLDALLSADPFSATYKIKSPIPDDLKQIDEYEKALNHGLFPKESTEKNKATLDRVRLYVETSKSYVLARGQLNAFIESKTGDKDTKLSFQLIQRKQEEIAAARALRDFLAGKKGVDFTNHIRVLEQTPVLKQIYKEVKENLPTFKEMVEGFEKEAKLKGKEIELEDVTAHIEKL